MKSSKKRNGAGRPMMPAGQRKVPLRLQVDPCLLDDLKVAALDSGRTLSQVARQRLARK